MPTYISLEEAKKQLNVEHDEDDVFICDLIDTAEDHLSNLLNRPLAEVETADGSLPNSLGHAVKMLVARFYADREGYRVGRVTELPFSLGSLIGRYRLER
jgi:hypothetical protein|nr:MAG TPA: Head Tail Connector Protein [Caudoviricetes sp.]